MKSHFDTLESVLDQTNLTEVLNMISRICFEKSEHIAANWQDQSLAKSWARDAAKLATAATKVTVR